MAPPADHRAVRVVIARDDRELARRAAAEIAEALRRAVATRGLATLAVSGGSTPGDLLAQLATASLPWERIHVFQVDERVAPVGHPERNLELLRARLFATGSVPADRVHAMPVEDRDLAAAAERYATELCAYAGDPPVPDVVQLGLGVDGHTASLLPGDPVLDVDDREVAVTGIYQGWRRLTLTVPPLARARLLVWVVRGADKRAMVERLVAGDPSIPAGRLPSERAVLFVDPDAGPATSPAVSGAE